MWKPIETAPVDGSFVLLFAGDSPILKYGDDVKPAAFYVGWNMGQGWLLWSDAETNKIITDVTHWMPLPEPPY